MKTHSSAPRFDLLTTATSGLLAALAALMTAALVLAMLGAHHAVLIAPLALLIGVPLYRLLRGQDSTPVSRAILLAVGSLMVASAVLNWTLHSELVVAGRDGATYANTASFLVDNGGLFPRFVEEPFVGADLEFGAPGFSPRADGTAWQQFLHATPALYGFFGEVFGRSAIFVVNALLSGVGVLAMFALARRFVGGWWAVLAAATMAASLPYLYYARSTFSEMAALVLSVGGLWAGHRALEIGSRRLGFGAGLLLGAAATVRIDTWMMGVALALLMIVTSWADDRESAAVSERMFTGFSVMAVLSLIDLILFSEPYLVNLRQRFVPLLLLVVALRLVVPLARAPVLQRSRRFVAARMASFEAGIVVVIVAGIALLWLVNPLVRTGTAAGVYGIADIQLSEGLAIEPTRSYVELAGWWLAWYLGIPLAAFGWLGVAFATGRAIRSGAAATTLVALACLVPGGIYLFRPSINPDHIWAIRRFLPVVVPILVIAGFAIVQRLLHRAKLHGLPSRVAAGVAALALAGPVLLASQPLATTADRPGVAGQMEALCAELDGVDSVLIIDSDPELPLSWQLGPPLRSWCGLSVAAAGPSSPVVASAAAVMASDPDLLPTAAEVTHTLSAEAWLSRLTGVPNSTIERSLAVWIDLGG